MSPVSNECNGQGPLATRRSIPARLLESPGPGRETLLRMLRTAVRVPDHGRRVPFRFLTIQGDARHRLGEKVEQIARERNPDTPPPVLEKDRQRFSRAPLVVAVVAVLDLDTGEEAVYTLMSGERLDIDAGHVSRDSPIGQALFGAKTGSIVTVETPQRTRRLRILSVTPPSLAPEPPPAA